MYPVPGSFADRPSRVDDKGRRYYRGYIIQKKMTGKSSPAYVYEISLRQKLAARCTKLQDAIDWVADQPVEEWR